jgi:putative ABC transport system substrate-binding protein
MRRRDFITVLGGAAAPLFWPPAARAQQGDRMRRVAVMMTAQPDDNATRQRLLGFQRRLTELGWTEGRNVRFEQRFTGGSPDSIRANVAEIVAVRPDLIVAQNTPMVAALHAQTEDLPIVFVQVSDPVGAGFVKALARPGGNVTGFTNSMSSLGGKWLELLRDAAPGMARVGFLFNRAASPGGGSFYLEPLKAAAASFGLKAIPLEVRNESEIEPAIAGFAGPDGGIVADSDAFITVNRERIIAAINKHRLPAIYAQAIFAASGGLLAYDPDTDQQWQAAAGYADRILRGEKPSDLPVQQPTRFALTINLKTAKALGLTVPPSLLVSADEVIE